MPGKKTVNLKKFLTDFRTGASDAELMARHGLDKRGLQKMMHVLEERQLVSAEALKDNRNLPPVSPRLEPTVPESRPPAENEPAASHAQPKDERGPDEKCSQCGAHVTEKMLTCPECGHVLPGETRWSRVQPEKSARLPVPPWLLGCIIALPLAIGLYVVFKHILVPMSTASIHKRTQTVGKPPPITRQPHPATSPTNQVEPPISALVKRFMDSGLLQSANTDFTAFTVSERWYDLTRDEKVALVTEIGATLLASGITAFEVKDDSGIPGARVNAQTIEILDRYGFAETIEREDRDRGLSPPAEEKPADSPGIPAPTGADD